MESRMEMILFHYGIARAFRNRCALLLYGE